MTRVLFLDHEDSFSANLVAALRALDAQVDVVTVERGTDEFSSEFEGRLIGCDGIVLGPGPGHPREYPATVALCQRLLQKSSPPPLFGVCLGLQCVAFAVGARVSRVAQTPVHGRRVELKGDFLLGPEECCVSTHGHATLHNSLGVPVDDVAFCDHFRVLAASEGVVLMAISNNFSWLLCQFHPESFGSTAGMPFIEAFVRRASSPKATAL